MPADEVHASLPTGGNGERMELRVGTKSLGFTTKDLAQILLIVVLGAFGYFMMTYIVAGQERGFAGLAHVLDRMGTNQQQTLDRLSQNQQALLELVHVNRQQMMTELSQQNHLVHEQTIALQKAVGEQTADLRRMFDRQRQMIIKLGFNQGRDPSQHLPLDVDTEHHPRER